MPCIKNFTKINVLVVAHFNAMLEFKQTWLTRHTYIGGCLVFLYV